jgi:hypothetical protein
MRLLSEVQASRNSFGIATYNLNAYKYVCLVPYFCLFLIIEIKFVNAKNIYFPLFAASAIGSISTLLSPLSASAITLTYTDQASFLSNTSSTYLENFESLTSTSNPVLFSQSGFSYSVSTDIDTPYSGTGNTGSIFLGVYSNTSNLTINFTSGNVTAVGGKFFFTDNIDNLASGTVTLTLNDGTVLNLTSPTSTPTPFGGFTTDGALITSLTFGGPGNPYATIDDLYVGTSISATPVPFDFSPNLGIGLLGGAWLIRKSLKKKLEKKSAQADIKG